MKNINKFFNYTVYKISEQVDSQVGQVGNHVWEQVRCRVRILILLQIKNCIYNQI